MIASVFSRRCKGYMIEDVENLFNYYLHSTFFVSYTLTSCTLYMQIFVKLCTFDCELTNLAIRNYTLRDV